MSKEYTYISVIGFKDVCCRIYCCGLFLFFIILLVYVLI